MMIRKSFFILILLAIVLMACSKKDGVENPEPAEPEKPEEEEQGEEKITAPLTGLEVDEVVDNRVIGVMVNNQIQARPQTGLSQADIVFEILSEANITRFLALFQSDLPEVVGPVRSAREYYFELATGYEALYVYHGAAKFVNQMIYDRGIEFIDGAHHDNDGVLFKRESFRKAPHNSYLQVGAVYEQAADKGYEVTSNITPLTFLGEEDEIPGVNATKISIAYSNLAEDLVEYHYDPETEKYTRFMGGEQFVELDTEAPILTDNIFIVETAHEVIDDAGRRKVDITSGGKALLVRKGKAEELEWKNENGMIIPVKDGEKVGFTPGQTWINIIPTNPGLEAAVEIVE